MCQECVSGYRTTEEVSQREGNVEGGGGVERVDGGNIACETVGIRKKETPGCRGQSLSVGIWGKNNLRRCCLVHFVADLKGSVAFDEEAVTEEGNSNIKNSDRPLSVVTHS